LRKTIWIIGGFVIGVTALCLTVAWIATRRPTTTAANPLPSCTGKGMVLQFSDRPVPLPGLTLADLDGRALDPASWKGKVLLVNFWATWCGPCREEMPAMQALGRELADRGLVVLAVNYEESPDRVRRFLRDAGLSLPVLLDAEGAVARQYRVTALPASFFVDRRGTLVGSVLGIRDWRGSAARRYVDELLRAPA